MATVLFWEKPGCVNNTRQKQMLREAGHEVLAHNLLTEPWDAVRLRRFFGDLPVAAWFNGAAPAVKQGAVLPDTLNEAQALAAMLADPLLIRRPLLQVGERCEAGFDPLRVDAWIGLTPQAAQPADLETCPRTAAATPCGTSQP
ncbi:MAG: ArsC/Spx/MgsR family protein [Candidatus Methylumidiphilus sp.]